VLEPEQPAETLAQKTKVNRKGLSVMKNGRHRNIAPWAAWLLTVTALCAAEEKDAMSSGSAHGMGNEPRYEITP